MIFAPVWSERDNATQTFIGIEKEVEIQVYCVEIADKSQSVLKCNFIGLKQVGRLGLVVRMCVSQQSFWCDCDRDETSVTLMGYFLSLCVAGRTLELRGERNVNIALHKITKIMAAIYSNWSTLTSIVYISLYAHNHLRK